MPGQPIVSNWDSILLHVPFRLHHACSQLHQTPGRMQTSRVPPCHTSRHHKLHTPPPRRGPYMPQLRPATLPSCPLTLTTP